MLSARVILARRQRGVGFGYADDEMLQRRIRVHANFAEYAPLALLLLAMAEARGASPVWLNAGGILLTIGRLAHAIGLSRRRTDSLGRIVGMTGTQTAILIGAALILLG